jgi:hypothetical protein
MEHHHHSSNLGCFFLLDPGMNPIMLFSTSPIIDSVAKTEEAFIILQRVKMMHKKIVTNALSSVS